MRAFRYSSSRGFTLLEVLVAFTVFALSAGALMQSLSAGMRSGDAAERVGRATALAQSKLAELELAPGASLGLREGSYRDADAGYGWRSEVAVTDPAFPDPEQELPVRLYTISVDVLWKHAGRAQSLRLQTLALEPRG